jgi:uncharacterized protein involved in exopolysaccharide biosynthesis
MSAASDVQRLAATPRVRWRVYIALAVILAVLSVFPRQYFARSKILAQDSDSAGLSSILGAFGGGIQNFASLLGAHQSVDVYLIIGRSHDVLGAVIRKLDLIGHRGFGNEDHAEVKLLRKVDVHSLAGGVIEVEAHDFDPDFAKALAATYADALRDRIEQLAREHIDQKKALVADRLARAQTEVASTEAALNAFREKNHLAAPEAQLGTAVALKASLEGQLQAKQIELQTAQQFATQNNIQVRAVEAEIASLRQQIGRTEAGGGGATPTLNGIAQVSADYLNLFRDVQFAQSLYGVYTRYSEEVAVEEIVNNSSSNVQVIEAAFVDPERHWNAIPLGLLALIALIAFYVEYYVPATGLHRRRAAP